MALKITAGEWIAANDENREQRDTKRKEFFEQSGIMPAERIRDVFVPGTARLSRTLPLFEAASANRVGGNEVLSATVQQMMTEIMILGLAVPDVMPAVEHKAIGMLGLSPEAFKNFFNLDLETTFAKSFMG